MRAIFITAVIAAAFGGCAGSNSTASIDQSSYYASQQQIYQEAQATLSKDMTACNEKHPGLTDKKPATPYVSCTIKAQMAWHHAKAIADGHPSLDFVKTVQTQKLASVDRYDRGQISKAELHAELARYDLSVKERIDADIAALKDKQRMQMAQQQQAEAIRQTRAAAVFQQGAAIMAGPPTVRCDHFGNSTTCRQQ